MVRKKTCLQSSDLIYSHKSLLHNSSTLACTCSILPCTWLPSRSTEASIDSAKCTSMRRNPTIPNKTVYTSDHGTASRVITCNIARRKARKRRCFSLADTQKVQLPSLGQLKKWTADHRRQIPLSEHGLHLNDQIALFTIARRHVPMLPSKLVS